MRYVERLCACCFLIVALTFCSVPLAYALLYNRGFSTNDYAGESSNDATSAISSPEYLLATKDGLAAQGALVTDIIRLLSAETYLDGARVEFMGEAIGDRIVAGNGYVWVNLADEKGMIGVFMTEEQADQIENFGHYGVEGSTISVVGIFSIACDEHGGELDVHAEKVQMVASGGEVDIPWSPYKLYLGLGLLSCGLLVFLAYRRYRLAAM